MALLVPVIWCTAQTGWNIKKTKSKFIRFASNQQGLNLEERGFLNWIDEFISDIPPREKQNKSSTYIFLHVNPATCYTYIITHKYTIYFVTMSEKEYEEVFPQMWNNCGIEKYNYLHNAKLLAELFNFGEKCFFGTGSMMFHPLFTIELHCLPSSGDTTEAKSLSLKAWASFKCIRVCLFGWLLDLLCCMLCFVAVITKANAVMESFHKTVTQKLLCSGETFQEVTLYKSNIPVSTTFTVVNLPVLPLYSIGILRVKQTGQTQGFYC